MVCRGRRNLHFHPGSALVIRVSPQQLDPLGGITARLLVTIVAILTPLIAVGMTITAAREVSNPWFELAALGTIIACCAYLVRATSPFRASFGRSAHALVLALACAAIVLEALAQHGTNLMVRDDWAPIVLALLIVTLGSYRPPWEIVIGSVLTAVVAGLSTSIGATSFRADAPTGLFAILAALPILAAGLAAAAFSRSLVLDLERWRAGALAEPALLPALVAVDSRIDDLALASAVGHRGLLESAAIPFLIRMSTKEFVTRRDGARARAIARNLRLLLIIDDEERWVTRLVAGTRDPRSLAAELTPEQRGCLRAIVNHVSSSAEFDASTLRLGFSVDPRHPNTARCTLRVALHAPRRARVQLAPFAAIARGVFIDADSSFDSRSARIVFRFAATPGYSPFRLRSAEASHGVARQKSASVES